MSSVPACNGLCVPSADIGISAADGGIAYPHPACDEHNLILRVFEVAPGHPAEWKRQLRAWHAGKPAPLLDSLGLGRVSDAFLEATIVLLRLRSAHLESVSAQ
ncbi:hypothetical protein [Microbacterium enclense]|uniref:hypothetical protein n=1 Tax=Microbacterium enclense TaxID=993073 RepID=UPI003F7F8FCD